MMDITERYRVCYRFWRAIGQDHWDALKMALDDLWCDGYFHQHR